MLPASRSNPDLVARRNLPSPSPSRRRGDSTACWRCRLVRAGVSSGRRLYAPISVRTVDCDYSGGPSAIFPIACLFSCATGALTVRIPITMSLWHQSDIVETTDCYP